MQDLHLHCKYSPDSFTNPNENIKKCIEKGLDVMAFTDHVDRFCQNNQNFDLQISTKDYLSFIDNFRKKYKDDIKILKGIEVGIAYENKNKIQDFIEKHNFDFVIGSIHAVNFKDVWSERRNIEKNPVKSFRKYYQYMIDSVKAVDKFSILGHIDYIDRYLEDKSKIPEFKDYEDLIDELLTILIKTNRGIEINTAGYRNGLSYPNPKDQILKRYKKLGGEIITLGSDSHTPDTCGYGIYENIKKLKDMGFDHISYFENKKEIKVSI